MLFFLTAILGALVAPGISGLGGVSGDAAATANTILAHEALYRLGFALGLISTACYVALMALFYQLFRPVSRSLALLAAFFGLVGCAIEGQIGQVIVLDHLYNKIGQASATGAVGEGQTSFSTNVSFQSTFPAGIQEGVLVLSAPSNANGSIAAAVLVKVLVNGAPGKHS